MSALRERAAALSAQREALRLRANHERIAVAVAWSRLEQPTERLRSLWHGVLWLRAQPWVWTLPLLGWLALRGRGRGPVQASRPRAWGVWLALALKIGQRWLWR